MILTIGNTKGGVGKTTLAVNLAITRAKHNRSVWLVDGDKQGTAQTAMGIRSNSNQSPSIACSSYVDGSILRSQVQLQSSNFDDVIIDAGGRDSTALRAALVLSDVLVIPFQPRSYDVWALDDINEILNEVMSMRDGLKVYAILNCADPQTLSIDNIEAAKAIKDYPMIEYLPTSLKRRKSFSNAAGSGLSVEELKPYDNKAILELNALYKHLF